MKKYTWNRKKCTQNFARLGKNVAIFVGRFILVAVIMLLLSADWEFI